MIRLAWSRAIEHGNPTLQTCDSVNAVQRGLAAGLHCYFLAQTVIKLGTLLTYAHLCNTTWLIPVQMMMYELITFAAWLLIIGKDVYWDLRWTRAKINAHKCFMCVRLLCCCEFCGFVSPRAELYSFFLMNNTDYWGAPESTQVENRLPSEHSQSGFSREMAENPPEVFCKDNKPLITVLVLMSAVAFHVSPVLQPMGLPC